MKIAALSLDVDGTLYEPRPVAVRRQARGLRRFLAARERVRAQPPFADGAALQARVLELLADGLRCTPGSARGLHGRLARALPGALTGDRGPFPGVRDALLVAVELGLRLAVFSDYEPVEKLRRLGLADLPWEVVVAGDRLGALKPHRRGFDAVVAGLRVPPGAILHVGDREDTDVAGALDAGLRAWRFVRTLPASTRAEHVFASWTSDLFRRVHDEPIVAARP